MVGGTRQYPRLEAPNGTPKVGGTYWDPQGQRHLEGPPGSEVVVSFLENFNQHTAADEPLLLVAAGCQLSMSTILQHQFACS